MHAIGLALIAAAATDGSLASAHAKACLRLLVEHAAVFANSARAEVACPSSIPSWAASVTAPLIAPWT